MYVSGYTVERRFAYISLYFDAIGERTAMPFLGAIAVRTHASFSLHFLFFCATAQEIVSVDLIAVRQVRLQIDPCTGLLALAMRLANASLRLTLPAMIGG